MYSFLVPTREEVSPNNQAIFDSMQKTFGKVPNLYAFFAWHNNALADYLALQNRKSTLSANEREIINLVVSEANACAYCVPAHTAVTKILFGLSDEDIIGIRRAEIPTDTRLDSLAKLTRAIVIRRGRPSEESLAAFFAAGYTQVQLIDLVINIGDKVISNYLHNMVQIPVDWPAVLPLSATE
jgi:uncharacterized peroxidase-related enzyme